VDAEFWLRKWRSNDIGFHKDAANAHLVRHCAVLALAPGSHIFLPLCGKSKDMTWLAAAGFSVTGAELSELAVQQFFQEWGVTPSITQCNGHCIYAAAQVRIFVGDIFALQAADLGAVDAVYDRAALVALPGPLRELYTQHLRHITATSAQLVVTFEYDQQQLAGPPFAVDADEIARHYAADYHLQCLARDTLEGGFKGLAPVYEAVWWLKPRAES
jgi:thiopurine S-methyltransferase